MFQLLHVNVKIIRSGNLRGEWNLKRAGNNLLLEQKTKESKKEYLYQNFDCHSALLYLLQQVRWGSVYYERRYNEPTSPTPPNSWYFMADISEIKAGSLLQSCLRKQMELNFDKWCCSGVFNWVIFRYMCSIKNFLSILAVLPSSSCKYLLGCSQTGFVCSVLVWKIIFTEHVAVSSGRCS